MKIPIKLFRSLWFWILIVEIFIISAYYFNIIRPYLIGFPESSDNFNISFLSSDIYIYWYNALETPINFIPINLLGPVLIFKILNLNFDLVVLLHVFIFCLALREIHRYTSIKILKFAVFFYVVH